MGGPSNPYVYALATSGINLYAGGAFMTAGGQVSAHLAGAGLSLPALTFVGSSVGFSNGFFQALLTGPQDASAIIEASTNLTNWTPIVTNPLPPGGLPLSLPTGTWDRCFYRARLQP
jgi:hypothetical protein